MARLSMSGFSPQWGEGNHHHVRFHGTCTSCRPTTALLIPWASRSECSKPLPCPEEE